MTPKQLDIVRHSVAMDSDGHRAYDRNYFVTDPDCDDGRVCCELVAAGLMRDHGPQSIAGGMHLYRVTDEGIRQATPVAPKRTRSQGRYQEFLNADSGLSFFEWLKTRRRTPSIHQ